MFVLPVIVEISMVVETAVRHWPCLALNLHAGCVLYFVLQQCLTDLPVMIEHYASHGLSSYTGCFRNILPLLWGTLLCPNWFRSLRCGFWFVLLSRSLSWLRLVSHDLILHMLHSTQCTESSVSCFVDSLMQHWEKMPNLIAMKKKKSLNQALGAFPECWNWWNQWATPTS